MLQNLKILSSCSNFILKKSAKVNSTIQNTFKNLGLHREIYKIILDIGYKTPTKIQEVAIKELLSEKSSSCLLASHTSSGKTLAYLLPILHLIRTEIEKIGLNALPKRPRVLVLAPTRELTEQIYDVANVLSLNSVLNLSLVNADKTHSAQRTLLNKLNDLVIATPSTLLLNHKISRVYFGNIDFLVLDEIDTMFVGGFGSEVVKIIEVCRLKTRPSQFIFVSAILTQSILKRIDLQIPKLKKFVLLTFQKGISGMVHSFKKIPQNINKLEYLIALLETEIMKGKYLLVFCNTIQSCRAVKNALIDCGLSCFQCHGVISSKFRREEFLRFINFLDFNNHQNLIHPLLQIRWKGTIMVCTDIAARGLDFRKIDHIINFDFPITSIDYQHRSGRTARADPTDG